MKRIIVEASDFQRNFKSNPTFKTIFDLQDELDSLVKLHNNQLSEHGFHSKTQIISDHIVVLRDKLILT